MILTGKHLQDLLSCVISVLGAAPVWGYLRICKQVHSLGAAALPGTTDPWPECFNSPAAETADSLGSWESFTLHLDSWHLPFTAAMVLEVILLFTHGLEILLNVLHISLGFLKISFSRNGVLWIFFFPSRNDSVFKDNDKELTVLVMDTFTVCICSEKVTSPEHSLYSSG